MSHMRNLLNCSQFIKYISKKPSVIFPHEVQKLFINKKYDSDKITFLKCLDKNMMDCETKHKLGLNQFETLERISNSFENGLNIAKIELCSDAMFYIDPLHKNTYKTNKFIITEIIPQTEKMCKLAVEHDGMALKHVDEKTYEICKLAVKQNGMALQFIDNQTDELCKIAVNNYGPAIQFVKNQTDEICKLAVMENSLALKYINNQTNEICKIAIEKDPYSLKYVKKQTEELCILAVWKDGLVLSEVKEQTDGICRLACQRNYWAKDFVRI